MLLGVTGAGKSCLGNFILKNEEAFKESKEIMKSETKTATVASALFEDKKICVVDTPGLGDTDNLGKHDFKAEDFAEDASSIITELTKITTRRTKGISAFLIVIPGHIREHSGTLNLLDFMDILGNYWDHAILVVTHGTELGKTAREQEDSFQSTVHGASCPPVWDRLYKKVDARCVIVEAKEYRRDTAYTDSIISKLLKFTDEISQQHGPYHDDLQSIGNQAFEYAMMQARENHSNLESRAAKEAIERITCKRVKDVVFKLIRIKMAGGKDVNQLEEMAKLKAEENQKLREETEEIRQQYEEEQKRRKQAEEERRKAEEETIRADEARRIAEDREKKERTYRIEAEEKTDRTQQLIDAIVRDKIEAKEESQEEREKRERAEKEKYDAEIKGMEEKLKREHAERGKITAENETAEEKRKREAAEQEKQTALHEKDEAKRKTDKAELEKERAIHEKNYEVHKREIAEKESAAFKQEAQHERSKVEAAQKEKYEAQIDKYEAKSEAQLQTLRADFLQKEASRAKEMQEKADREREKAEKFKEREEREAAKEQLEATMNRNIFERIFNLKPTIKDDAKRR